MTSTLDQLVVTDRLEITEINGKPLFIHNDHRWLLPLVAQAQEDGLLPRPCTLVCYDYHHDGLIPGAINKIKGIVSAGVTVEAIIDLCANDLKTLDDDWVIAGIELGLFKNVVIFGVEERHNAHDRGNSWKHAGYQDHRGQSHTVWTSSATPGESIGFQGDLSDLARRDELDPLWSALEWESRNGDMVFSQDSENILLDFDLDCFSAEVRGCRIAWPDAVFERAFDTPGYGAAEKWTGQSFLDALVERAGIITVAREPECCGGEDVADEIWDVLKWVLTRSNPKNDLTDSEI